MKNLLKKGISFSTGMLLLMFIFNASSCSKKKPLQQNEGKLIIVFQYSVGNQPLQTDTMRYINAAGNPYLVSEIQYFISDVCLHEANGDSLLLNHWDDIHYVDTDLPETWHYPIKDSIPSGDYASISFTFGINAKKNQSLMFVNPPESDMFWPEYLGGGYHYMKLNGKWLDTAGIVKPFNFHLGIGQEYDSTGQITGFVQNYFNVKLPASSFSISSGKTVQVTVDMDVNEWFEDPVIFNFNIWGGNTMQNQAAMHVACQNGHNVFSVKNIATLLEE